MTVLLRRITETKAWKNAFERAAADSDSSVPAWCYAEFVPSPRDEGGLSVYEFYGDPKEFQRISAAYALMDRVSGELMWVGASRADIEGAGLTINEIKGETFDDGVNQLHREILVKDWNDIGRLTSIFTEGSVHRLSQAQIGEAIKSSVTGGNIHLDKAFKRSGSPGRDRLIELLENKTIRMVPNQT